MQTIFELLLMLIGLFVSGVAAVCVITFFVAVSCKCIRKMWALIDN